MQTAWGQHSLITATRTLLHAALKDPLNERFVLLSENAVPLYPAVAIHQQLMSETKSRLNACFEGVRPQKYSSTEAFLMDDLHAVASLHAHQDSCIHRICFLVQVSKVPNGKPHVN